MAIQQNLVYVYSIIQKTLLLAFAMCSVLDIVSKHLHQHKREKQV